MPLCSIWYYDHNDCLCYHYNVYYQSLWHYDHNDSFCYHYNVYYQSLWHYDHNDSFCYHYNVYYQSLWLMVEQFDQQVVCAQTRPVILLSIARGTHYFVW